MGKCSACQENKCERKYENRYMCKGREEKIECTCTCQESEAATFWKATGSIAGGVACVAGGVAVTVLTAGIGIPIGGAIIGAGSSLVTNPIAKQMTGECMTGEDLLTDIAVGSTVGALSGGIGAGGSVLSKGASGVAKFGIRAAAGAASGAVGGAVSETARAMNREKVTLGSFAKSVGVGIVCGGVGGASSHVASNASKAFSNGVVKAATRVVVQTSTATATDAGIQLCETGKIDSKRLLLTATSQATVASTAECARNKTIKTNMYADKMNKRLVKETLKQKAGQREPDPDLANLKKEMVESLHEANRLSPETIKKQAAKVQEYNKVQSKINELQGHKENIIKINEDPDLTPRQRFEQKQNYIAENNLGEGIKTINSKIRQLQRTAVRPDLIGKKNLHFLHDEHTGQIAIDVHDGNDNRSGRRLIADIKPGKKFLLSDYIEDHNYNRANKPGQKQYYDPLDALSPNQFNKKNLKEGD